jgi:hypothetical protein
VPPVHSTGRQCEAFAFNETCPFHWQMATCPFHRQAATCSFRRRRACLFHWQAAHPCCRLHYAHHYSHGTKGSCRRISILCGLRTSWHQEIAQASLALVTPCISFHYAPGPTCRGSASLYVPPLSYKREGTQRYKADQLRRNSSSQAHKFSRRNSDTQYNT